MGKRRAILAEILADTDNNFLLIIDKLALNCSSNEDVFGHIKSLFDAVLQEKAFIDKNEKKKIHWQKRKSQTISKVGYICCKTSKSDEWRNITDKIKNGSGWHWEKSLTDTFILITAQKMKFSIKGFFSKCDQIRSSMRIWSH